MKKLFSSIWSFLTRDLGGSHPASSGSLADRANVHSDDSPVSADLPASHQRGRPNPAEHPKSFFSGAAGGAGPTGYSGWPM